MLVDADLLYRARKGNRQAVIEVLAAQYPATYRMAYALSGRADVGAGVVTWVTRQSFRALPKWIDEDAPQRWFRHHTILTVRRAARWKPEAQHDTLVREPDRQDQQYVAFIRALRALPQQQTEAFVLANGEDLPLRSLAVAMDCSTTAAEVHLREAEDRLRPLAGGQFDAMLSRMRWAYQQLTPTEDLILSRVGSTVRRLFWPRLLARLLRLVILGFILGGVAWLAWRYWPSIRHLLRGILTTDSPA